MSASKMSCSPHSAHSPITCFLIQKHSFTTCQRDHVTHRPICSDTCFCPIDCYARFTNNNRKHEMGEWTLILGKVVSFTLKTPLNLLIYSSGLKYHLPADSRRCVFRETEYTRTKPSCFIIFFPK